MMPATLTVATVQAFEARIRALHGGVAFELTATRGLLIRESIELSTLVVRDRKQGTGTGIMRHLCSFADRHGITIRLTPASRGDYGATTSRARLIRFYKRFGFVEDNGGCKDFAAISRLIRKSAHAVGSMEKTAVTRNGPDPAMGETARAA